MTMRNADNIVVDEFGNVDVAYYEAKAEQLRMETLASGFRALRRAVVGLFSAAVNKVSDNTNSGPVSRQA